MVSPTQKFKVVHELPDTFSLKVEVITNTFLLIRISGGGPWIMDITSLDYTISKGSAKIK